MESNDSPPPPAADDDPVRVLWVTDFEYPAKGRDYGAEDKWLTAQLGPRFLVTTIGPVDAPEAVSGFDLVVVRNSGPVLGHADAYARFRERAVVGGVPVYNELCGCADMLGKKYLLQMYEEGMPVIPSARPGHLQGLPAVPRYVVKPLHGADSVGLTFVNRSDLPNVDRADVLVQPYMDMEAELSFVFVDDEYQYALSTSRGGERWEVHQFEASAEEVAFAREFIAWNRISHGIQRVDACRTKDGSLLLVELEDLNPYLSLDVLSNATRERFVRAFQRALENAISAWVVA